MCCTWRDEDEPEMAPLPEEMWAFLGLDGSSLWWDLCLKRAVLQEGLQPDLFPRVIEKERAM